MLRGWHNIDLLLSFLLIIIINIIYIQLPIVENMGRDVMEAGHVHAFWGSLKTALEITPVMVARDHVVIILELHVLSNVMLLRVSSIQIALLISSQFI